MQKIEKEMMWLSKKLNIKLTEAQKKFIDKVNKDNKLDLNRKDKISTKNNFVDNIVCLYLSVDNSADKISAAKIMNNFKKVILEKYIENGIINPLEIKYYTTQKVSSFKEFDNSD